MNPERPASAGPPADELQAGEPPPILGSWQRMYALVLGVFVAVVLLLYVLTQVYK